MNKILYIFKTILIEVEAIVKLQASNEEPRLAPVNQNQC